MKTFIIAEVGVNYNKSFEMACKLCDMVKEAKANAVKFQTWITDKIYNPDNPRYQMLKDLEMPFDFFKQIKKYCDDIGVMFLSTPDDEESLDFLCDELNMPIVKVGSGNLTNNEFLKKVATKDRPIILSTGMGTWVEVIDAVKCICNANDNFNSLEIDPAIELTLLHCVTLYPTEYKEINLKAMKEIGTGYNNGRVGLSDHTMGIEISIAAVAMGASVIEKHLTLDRNLPGPDHKASIEPHEFKQMVQCIRNVEIAMGDGVKKPCQRELEQRETIRFKSKQKLIGGI